MWCFVWSSHSSRRCCRHWSKATANPFSFARCGAEDVTTIGLVVSRNGFHQFHSYIFEEGGNHQVVTHTANPNSSAANCLPLLLSSWKCITSFCWNPNQLAVRSRVYARVSGASVGGGSGTWKAWKRRRGTRGIGLFRRKGIPNHRNFFFCQ